MDTTHQIGQTVTLVSPDSPKESVRFDVRERPVLLEADFCHWNDRYSLMRVGRICGNRIQASPYEANGQAVVLSQQLTRFVLNEPGKYGLVSPFGNVKGALVRRTTLGIQHG